MLLYPYAVSGTDISSRYAMSGCAPAIALRACYAMSGTDIATVLPASRLTPSRLSRIRLYQAGWALWPMGLGGMLGVVSCAICLRARYAMPGTDLAYRATRSLYGALLSSGTNP
eukprot:2376111-Rhodomonas_salina.1